MGTATAWRRLQGSKNNNILPVDAEASVLSRSTRPGGETLPLLSRRAGPDPRRRGVFVASSNDGVHWTSGRSGCFVRARQPAIRRVGRAGLQQYAIYLRAWNPGRTSRVWRRATSSAVAYDASGAPFLVWGKDKIPTPSREIRP